MTREEFIQAIEEIVKRDAEQRAEIEKLKSILQGYQSTNGGMFEKPDEWGIERR